MVDAIPGGHASPPPVTGRHSALALLPAWRRIRRGPTIRCHAFV